MSVMTNVITVAITACLLSWPAGADTTKLERFYYFTGCAPIAYKVNLWESSSDAMFINKAKFANMIELSLRQNDVYAPGDEWPYMLLLTVTSYPEVATFTLRFLKLMQDVASEEVYVASPYLQAFSITPDAFPLDLYIETRVRMHLDPFIETYMRVNRTAC